MPETRCPTCAFPLSETPNTHELYCGDCDGPPVKSPIVAIAHVLSRVQSDPNFRWYMIGTEGFARLCKIEALLCGLPYKQVRSEREQVKFRNHFVYADVVVEQSRKELIRQALRDADDDTGAVTKVKELCEAGAHDVMRMHREMQKGALVL